MSQIALDLALKGYTPDQFGWLTSVLNASGIGISEEMVRTLLDAPVPGGSIAEALESLYDLDPNERIALKTVMAELGGQAQVPDVNVLRQILMRAAKIGRYQPNPQVMSDLAAFIVQNWADLRMYSSRDVPPEVETPEASDYRDRFFDKAAAVPRTPTARHPWNYSLHSGSAQ